MTPCGVKGLDFDPVEKELIFWNYFLLKSRESPDPL